MRVGKRDESLSDLFGSATPPTSVAGSPTGGNKRQLDTEGTVWDPFINILPFPPPLSLCQLHAAARGLATLTSRVPPASVMLLL